MTNGKYECPFFKKETQIKAILSGVLVFSIYDNYPVSQGHILVIPYRHCSNYFDLTQEEQSEAWSMISEMEKKLDLEFKPNGFNIGVNIGEAAGQTINHVHLHLIPRYMGDMENPRGGIRHCVSGKGYY